MKDASTQGVHEAKVVLGGGIVLRGGFAVPFHRFGIITGDAAAFGVHDAEVVLGARIALHGGLTVPLNRLGIISSDASAFGVHDAEVVLGEGIALRGGLAVPFRRLDIIPGDASALAATLGDGSAFQSSRQLAAWLGLVPRQTSSGGKARLGRITKQGDPYLHRLLVIGATSVLKRTRRGQETRPSPYPWAAALLRRKPYRLATVALANKMARIVWAVLTSGQPYRKAAAV